MPRPTTPNVLRIFRAATPDEIADGREWYRRARLLAEELAAAEWQRGNVPGDERGDVDRAAAVIAVLSPRQSWDRNVTLARQAYTQAIYRRTSPESTRATIVEYLPTLGRQREQVARLLVDRDDPDDVVRGPKVRAFWHTIAHPDDPRAVVVDRHAIDVACGAVLDDARRGKLVGRKGGYDTLAACYVRAAKQLNSEGTEPPITPAEVQAVTWHVWRRYHAAKTSANVRERRAITVTVDRCPAMLAGDPPRRCALIKGHAGAHVFDAPDGRF